MPFQGLEGKVRATIGTPCLQVVVHLSLWNTADKAEAACPWELCINVTGFAVLLKQAMVNTVLARCENRAARTTQAVFIQVHPVLLPLHHF